MISFFDEVNAGIEVDDTWKSWMNTAVASEQKTIEEVNIILCDDDFLLGLNKQYLNHETLTDIITFDTSYGNTLSGELYISYPRIVENATIFEVSPQQELRRVIIHGMLHLAGYADKTASEKRVMRDKENEKLKMFHVEQ